MNDLKSHFAAVRATFRQRFGLGERYDLPFKEPTTMRSVYAGSAVINLLALALPLTVLQVYDRVLPNSAFSTLTYLVLGLIVSVLLDAGLKYLRAYLMNWSAASFVHKTSMTALSRLMATPAEKLQAMPASDRIKNLSSISDLGDHLGGNSKLVLVDLLFIPIFIAVIYLVGGPIILAPVALFCAFAVATIARTSALGHIITDRETQDSRKSDFIIEVLRAIYTVKSIAMEPLILRRYERLQSSASMTTKQLIKSTSGTQNIGAFYATASTICVVCVGALLVFNGRMTVGGLACCMLLSSQLLQPMMRLITAWNETQIAEHHREHITKLLDLTNDAKPAEVNSTPATPKKPVSISLSDVTIKYGDNEPLLEKASINISAGEIVAIDGIDGSGRSSLLKVIAGSSAPHAGSVVFDGTKITDDNRALMRASIRYVDQSPTTFRGTVLENITVFGLSSVKSARWAATMIGLEPIIFKMPLGYDTPLNSQLGRDVPAAIAQRLCIARALATTPSVLVFDDANTALDIPGERDFLEAIKKLRGKVTIVLATHRPSLRKLADTIYTLEDGALTPHHDADPQQSQAG